MNRVAADVSPLILHWRSLSRLTSAATSQSGFMVPMHSEKRKGAFHKPSGSSAGVSPALPNRRARRPLHYFAAKVHGPNPLGRRGGVDSVAGGSSDIGV